MRIRAAGFDLGNTLMGYDGVALNWQSGYSAALRAAVKAGGLAVDVDEAALDDACGRLARYNTRLYPREKELPASAIFADVLEPFGAAGGEELECAVDAFFQFFRQSYRVYDDALSCLTALAQEGIAAGILTDVPYGMPDRWVMRDVEAFLPSAACVLSSVAVGYRKPHPAGFLRLAEALGAHPGTMLFVGDERKDVAGACNAGMVAVLLDRDRAKPRCGQDATISSLRQLPELIDSII